MPLNEEDLSMIKYFWENKRDIRSYAEFNDLVPTLRVERPEIIMALENYENSLLILDNVIKAI